jgi:hypothetical protein
MTDAIDLSDDFISVEAITERVEELREARDNLREEFDADDNNFGVDFDNWVRNQVGFSSLEADELKALETVLESLKGYGGDHQWQGDWYPQTLIARSAFVGYIEEIIDDCYEVPKEMRSGEWPFRHMHIDYEAAAAEAEDDYSAVDVQGSEYLYR